MSLRQSAESQVVGPTLGFPSNGDDHELDCEPSRLGSIHRAAFFLSWTRRRRPPHFPQLGCGYAVFSRAVVFVRCRFGGHISEYELASLITPTRDDARRIAANIKARRSDTYCNCCNVKVTARLRLKPSSNAKTHEGTNTAWPLPQALPRPLFGSKQLQPEQAFCPVFLDDLAASAKRQRAVRHVLGDY